MSVSLREIEERVVLKEKVMKLKPRWFYMRKGGHMYKGMVEDVFNPLHEGQVPEDYRYLRRRS